MTPRPRRPHAFVAATSLLLAVVGRSNAAEPLVWKFEPGLANRYRMTQAIDVDKTGAGGDVTVKSEMTLGMSWKVEEVKSDGSAVLAQRIDALRIKISTGDGQQAEIDSASKEDPDGQAAMLAPLVKAITTNSFTVTMTPRGEVTEVEVPEAIGEALKTQPGAGQMGELATPEGFKKLVGQASFVLPEALESGESWTAKTETKLPSVGTQTAETTYRYEGPKEVEGKPLEAFSAKVAIKFTGGEVPVEVAEQESQGEILFNREAGRLESSHIKQDTKLKIAVNGQTVTQKIAQTVDMKWLPEDAE